MIEKIKMINFESHVNTEIDFTNGITILTGNSAQGKSGIFRALRFVLLNLSESEDSINYDADECEVEIIYNGHSIKRVRSRKGKNEYWLDGILYKAFGQSVPNDIMNVLNLNSVNFEWQFDKRPFLLAETGGYVATKLNEIVDLKLIDSSLKNIESERRSSRKEKERLSKEEKEYLESIKEYHWVELAEQRFKRLEQLQIEIDLLVVDLDMLKELSESISDLSLELNEINLISGKVLRAINEQFIEYEKAKQDFVTMEDLRDSYLLNFNKYHEIHLIKDRELEKLLENSETNEKIKQELIYAKTLNRDYNSVSEDLENLGDLIRERRLVRLSNSLNDLEELRIAVSKGNDLISKTDTLMFNLSNLEIELNKLKREYKEIAPDVCPICGNEMNKELE